MGNNFPAVAAGMHVDGIDYVLTMTPVGGGGFLSPGGTMTMFNHGFGTGTGLDGVLLYSYDGFDQDALEGGLRQLLTLIAGAAGQLIGIDPAAIIAAMSVQRVWAFATDAVMPDGRPGSLMFTDSMSLEG